jgi:uncharacterized protein
LKAFFNPSALTKLYIEEAGSEEATRAIREATELGVSSLCIPEVISALNRNRREGKLSDKQYNAAKTRFLEDMNDAHVLALTLSVIGRSVSLLENNSLRAADAVHVACALEWQADLFVSGDIRQIAAARKAKLKTRAV